MGSGLLAGTVGALAAPFRVIQGSGPFSRLPGEVHTVVVAFSPGPERDPGQFQAPLAITSNDPDQAMVSVPVAGESVGVGKLVMIPSRQQGLALKLTARDFIYGACPEEHLQLQNGGTAALTGRVEGLADPFAVVEGEGDFSLAPGESRKVTVRFCAPVGALPATYETLLVIASSDREATRVEVPVRVSFR